MRIIAALSFISLLACTNGSDFTMAALGDSITAGFNSSKPLDQRQNSWSTGPAINSHLKRLQAIKGGSPIKAYNFSVAGVTSKDLLRQAAIASTVVPDYVTILIGNNDICRGKSAIDFGNNVEAAILGLIFANPDIAILISSLPDIVAGRKAGGKVDCSEIWKKILNCKRADTIAFKQEWISYNLKLESIADKYESNVKFAKSVKSLEITPRDISNVDCFHPSIRGQQNISTASWNDGFY